MPSGGGRLRSPPFPIPHDRPGFPRVPDGSSVPSGGSLGPGTLPTALRALGSQGWPEGEWTRQARLRSWASPCCRRAPRRLLVHVAAGLGLKPVPLRPRRCSAPPAWPTKPLTSGFVVSPSCILPDDKVLFKSGDPWVPPWCYTGEATLRHCGGSHSARGYCRQHKVWGPGALVRPGGSGILPGHPTRQSGSVSALCQY